MIPKAAICFLACLQLIISQPLEFSQAPEQYKLPLGSEASAEEINNLSIVTAGEINQEQNEDIDSLIEKVKQVTSRYKKDVDGTIAEVQQLLEADYSLPRLTRGEIVEILDNLTRADIEELRRHGHKNRKDYQKALMLVMPYTSKDSKFNVEELYTKPPITHIIGSNTVKPYTPKKNVEILKEVSASSTSIFDEVSTSSTSINTAPPSTVTIEVPRLEESTLRTQYAKRPTKPKFEPLDIEITTLKPKKQFLFNKQTTKPDFVVSTHRPVYTKPTRFSNHKYQEEPHPFQQPNQGFRIVNPPSFQNKPINAEFLKQTYPSYKTKPNSSRLTIQSSVYKAPLPSITRPRYRTTTTVYTSTESPAMNIDLPDDMKDLVRDLQMAEPVKSKNKYSSQYIASETKFQKPTTTENMQDILGAIGGTSKTKLPDLSGVADTLTPDMKNLLMSFGLIEDPNTPAILPTQAPREPETVEIKPISYTQFKPLPDDAPSRDDMFDFLSSYGLIGTGRSSKKIKEYEAPKHLSEVPHIDMEMIPESMHSVLSDIGLTQSTRRGKRIQIDSPPRTFEKSHVFNPVESSVSSDELKRLNQLMETLVRLEKLNRTVTEEDFQDVDLENIAEITKILSNNEKVIPLDSQNGPDPLNYDVGLEKNEVKRQESTTKIVESTTKKEESSTEEPKNPQIEALEESFGGSVTTKAEDATLPPPRKTGFYYLVDWNTFLEVGEEGKNKVNIRFSPRAGDPSRFLKVTVP